MARPLRIEYAGAFYYVTCRGNDRKAIFISEADRKRFMAKEGDTVPCGTKAALSPDMAIRIAQATNTSPESWLYMQVKLDLWAASLLHRKVYSFGQVAE